MTTVKLELPDKLIPVFTPPRGSLAYRGAYGGRGSAKTRTFALMTAVFAIQMASENKRGVILCAREFMVSLEDSSLTEIKEVIRSIPWLESQFDIGEKYIRTKCGRIKYLFAGLRHNVESIKSKARVLLTWVDEAETVSEMAWNKLINTVMREDGSELWATWNPESPESATHRRFREHTPERSMIIELNWMDNPWFPAGLEQERVADQKYRPETYGHTWEGEFLTLTAAQVFGGRYDVEEFEVDPLWDGPYQGGDWGYSQDPTVAIRAYISDRTLYISHDVGGKAIELDDVPARMCAIPDFAVHTTRWDSAQPSMISHVKGKGLPKSVGVKKGAGSIEDGIAFIRAFDRVIIHPRCVETLREFRLYAWKVDRLSGDITNKLIDDNNHYIDALRYALEPIMRQRKGINWAAMG